MSVRRRTFCFVAFLAAFASVASGCRRMPGTELEIERARVEAIDVRFLSETEARFEAALAVPPTGSPGQARQVQWELWVDGHWFASGAQAVETALPADVPGLVRFEARLQHRPVALSGEPAEATIGFRGALLATFGSAEERLPFSRQLELRLESVPRFDGSSGD